jgi:hypothetical protein
VTRRPLVATALVLAAAGLVVAVLAPVERLMPDSPADDPVREQLCWAGSHYADLLAHVARLHLAGGGTQTPTVLVGRIERLHRLCGTAMSLPDGFAALACQVGHDPQPPANCPKP